MTLAGVLLYAVEVNRSGMRWLDHSATVLKTAGDVPAIIYKAEAGSRGFALTQDPRFVSEFDDHVAAANRQAARLVTLTADNPSQQGAASALRDSVATHLRDLSETVGLARVNEFERAREVIADGDGLSRLETVSSAAERFIAEERRLQNERILAVERQLRTTTRVVIVGVIAVLLIILYITILSARRIRRPISVISETMAALAGGSSEARITSELGSIEFDQVAAGYNRMADDLSHAVAEQRAGAKNLQEANTALQQNTAELQERGEIIELLGSMAHRMQAARTDEELAAVLKVFVPRVLPDLPGVLYAHNNSRNLLVPIATWGGICIDAAGFAPDQCWALRRGQSHSVGEPGSDILCTHVEGEASDYHCEPLLAAGEVIGVFYLRGDVTPKRRFSLTVLSENIASALVNHRLQRGLREQTIRDPLTALFNRRYMEETLALEIARAARSSQPLSVIMCDVDHFKRFNDEFGHEAGDAVLSAVAAEMVSRFRDGDVVCRYGGEEFTIIAPGTAVQQLAARAEIVRKAISALHIRNGGRSLGATSMSFGVASWSPLMDREGAALIKAADAALYRAKREGRNRVIIDGAPDAQTGEIVDGRSGANNIGSGSV
ncbi:diguanylate cyclase [Sphingomonas sp. IW22]|uniref:sensor domain-containing diguanylate cyclase n=1 Tax=Sphingomonas sp. IW22 TaxID=3242489 RepID=UPI0035209455